MAECNLIKTVGVVSSRDAAKSHLSPPSQEICEANLVGSGDEIPVWAKPTVLIKVSAYGAECSQQGLGQRPKVFIFKELTGGV